MNFGSFGVSFVSLSRQRGHVISVLSSLSFHSLCQSGSHAALSVVTDPHPRPAKTPYLFPPSSPHPLCEPSPPSTFSLSRRVTSSCHFSESENNMAASTGASDGVEYPFGGPRRVIVPPEFRSWRIPWLEYRPPMFTIPMILKGDKPWADPDVGHPGFSPRFNQMDGRLNRKSNAGLILTNKDGYPLNPTGRTGIKGRGSLGRWGPNHAADCIVTRFKTDLDGKIVMNENRAVVEFIAIRRQDGGGLAIPGGMIEPGEEPIESAKREFKEEVIGEESDAALDPMLSNALYNLFSDYTVVDKCYVEDRRNTDNAWIETFAVNFHIPGAQATTNTLNTMKFKGGSDAKEAFWVEFQPDMKLYASHATLLKKAVEKIHAKS